MTLVDRIKPFLKRVTRGEHLVREDGKRFETTPAERVMAAEILELWDRIEKLERELEAWRAISPYRDGKPPVVFVERDVPDLFDPNLRHNEGESAEPS